MSRFFLFILLNFFLSACDFKLIEKHDAHDRELNFYKEDFYSSLKNNEPTTKKDNNDSDFEIAPLIINPEPPKFKSDKLVTMSVTDDIPLKDVLIELGRMADINIQIAGAINGGVNMRVTDTPITEVLGKICESANLRYDVEDNIIKIQQDTAYLVNYPVDFLNMVRSNKGTMNINVSVGGSGGESSGTSSSSGEGGGGSGSGVNISTDQNGDLWSSVEKDIAQIISNGTEMPFTSNMNASSSNVPAQSTTVNTPVNTTSQPGKNYVSINKQAGVITIYANKKMHENIRNYLAKIINSVSAQALIEAKVVEVALNDEYRAGINWSWLDHKIGGVEANFLTNPITDFTDKTSDFRLGFLNGKGRSNADGTIQGVIPSDNSGRNLINLVNLMNYFGTTRTLSSPRVHAVNNQQAVISFAQNYVYFTVKVSTDSSSGTTSSSSSSSSNIVSKTVTSEAKTVPIGIILSLQPSINLATQEITMNVRPSISKVVSTVKDPATAYAVSDITDAALRAQLLSDIPVVEVKQMDSIVKIKSGEVMVIGGIMETRSENAGSGVPFLGDVPGWGNLFKNSGKKDKIIQTVIFIRATIVPGFNVSEDDKRFYNNFAGKELNRLKF